jgi:8-oxo-dGTP diphosphatase
MIEKEQQAVVAYILRDDGKILSVSRKETGQRSAPGGKVEPGETLYDAMKREVKEETGCEVLTAYPVYDGLHLSGRRVTAYRVHEWFHEPTAREPGTRVEWVDPIDIANGLGSEYHSVALLVAGILK